MKHVFRLTRTVSSVRYEQKAGKYEAIDSQLMGMSPGTLLVSDREPKSYGYFLEQDSVQIVRVHRDDLCYLYALYGEPEVHEVVKAVTAPTLGSTAPQCITLGVGRRVRVLGHSNTRTPIVRVDGTPGPYYEVPTEYLSDPIDDTPPTDSEILRALVDKQETAEDVYKRILQECRRVAETNRATHLSTRVPQHAEDEVKLILDEQGFTYTGFGGELTIYW